MSASLVGGDGCAGLNPTQAGEEGHDNREDDGQGHHVPTQILHKHIAGFVQDVLDFGRGEALHGEGLPSQLETGPDRCFDPEDLPRQLRGRHVLVARIVGHDEPRDGLREVAHGAVGMNLAREEQDVLRGSIRPKAKD